MTKRLEITISDEVSDRLDEARGHERRASFVKRVLEAALVESDRSGSVSDRAVERGLAEAKDSLARARDSIQRMSDVEP